MRPPFFSRTWCVVVLCVSLSEIYCSLRPAYMNFGGFGMVAAHELTVRLLPSSESYNLVTFGLHSTLSILPVACTTRMANLKNGGPKRRVESSTRGRSASRNSTPNTRSMTARAERLTLTYVRPHASYLRRLMTRNFTGRTASLVYSVFR